MPKRGETNRKTNIWVARCIPLIILGLFGYVSWVITKLICVDFLLNSRNNLFTKRSRPAVAILVTYYLLLLLTVTTYARLIEVVARSPGLIPRGRQYYVEKARKRVAMHSERTRSGNDGRASSEKAYNTTPRDSVDPSKTWQTETDDDPSNRMDLFWMRDVFVCDVDGRPPYCSTCHNWKPDRSHHCSELDRCVLKFDHFCPWVGGVVSERSFKFFVQFTFYAALYTLEVLVVTAYFFAERRHHQSGFIDGNWIATLALAGLFFLFSGGMCLSSGQFVFINSTTVENLSRKTKVWSLAICASPELLEEAADKNVALRMITYPRPPEERAGFTETQQEECTNIALDALQNAPSYRTFVVLETEPGENPFDIGLLANFQDIMGYTLWDWLLPIKVSPCTQHNDPRSFYRMGPVVDNMKASVGLKTWLPKRRRSHKSGYQQR